MMCVFYGNYHAFLIITHTHTHKRKTIRPITFWCVFVSLFEKNVFICVLNVTEDYTAPPWDGFESLIAAVLLGKRQVPVPTIWLWRWKIDIFERLSDILRYPIGLVLAPSLFVTEISGGFPCFFFYFVLFNFTLIIYLLIHLFISLFHFFFFSNLFFYLRITCFFNFFHAVFFFYYFCIHICSTCFFYMFFCIYPCIYFPKRRSFLINQSTQRPIVGSPPQSVRSGQPGLQRSTGESRWSIAGFIISIVMRGTMNEFVWITVYSSMRPGLTLRCVFWHRCTSLEAPLHT